jgi:hypothetical protein
MRSFSAIGPKELKPEFEGMNTIIRRLCKTTLLPAFFLGAKIKSSNR